MGILNIQPVTREEAKIVFGLAGPSGSGKTFTALKVAFGMAGKVAAKVGLLDTENRRGALYDKILGAPFMIGHLSPPFSPARYVEALMEFAQSGIEVLVVDSMSHEWEGQGGCDEIANRPKANGEPRAIPDWISAKREHHRFMRCLLSMPCHVVPCFRAREKTDFADPKRPVSLGIQPIAEKNCMFEMTASFMLDDGGQKRVPIKTIPDFFPFLKGDGFLTVEHGEQIRAWAGGIDPMERLRNMLRLGAGMGMEGLGEAWRGLDAAAKRALESFKDTLKPLAQAADAERLAVKGDNGAPEPREGQ